uniref:Uncharacterized protein n=1 Tax=Aegilops tauschii TaxID=37682 RepID=M8AZ96_AEGTA
MRPLVLLVALAIVAVLAALPGEAFVKIVLLVPGARDGTAESQRRDAERLAVLQQLWQLHQVLASAVRLQGCVPERHSNPMEVLRNRHPETTGQHGRCTNGFTSNSHLGRKIQIQIL